jgi:hypothetical protein
MVGQFVIDFTLRGIRKMCVYMEQARRLRVRFIMV